jgi:phosphoribosyl 1,2-cyclic phosphodiesterase
VIYASAGAAWALTAKCPALSGQVRGFRAGDAFDVGSVAVETFPTPHDTKDSVGYALALDGVRACVATDMGHVPDELLPRLAGCGYLLLESNHDVELLRNGGYPTHLKRRILGDWGHLSNQDAARTAVHCARTGTRHITLGHLSKENNRPELAYEVTYNALTAAGFCPGRDVMLDVAPAVGRSEVFAVVNSCGGGGQLRIIPLGAQAN